MRRPCMALWKTPQMAWNGELGVCCMDTGLYLSLGNLKDKSFNDMWLGDKVHQWRLSHIRGDFDKVCAKKQDGSTWSCAECPGIRHPPVTYEEIVDYLKITGEEKEILPYLKRVNPALETPNKEPTSFLSSPWLRENWWLTLELNATCNLKCPMCSQFVSEIDGKPMPFETIKKLIDNFIKNGTKFHSLTPFYRGESLLHPEFNEIAKYLTEVAKQKLWGFMTLHTNATLLTEEKTNLILDMFAAYPRGELFFSIDAATDETYKKIRKGGNFAQMQKNIIHFIEEKAKRSQTQPFMVFQFIVMDENVNEAVKFYRFWRDVLVKNKQPVKLVKTLDRLINVAEYETNLIYFRRKEGPDEERQHSLELQQRVFEELKNEP